MTNSQSEILSENFLPLANYRMNWNLTLIHNQQDLNPGKGLSHLKAFTNSTTSDGYVIGLDENI